MGIMDWFGRGDDPEKLLDKAVRLYDSGKYGEAADVLRKAADMGYAPAQNNLGYMYEAGRGVDRDLGIAEALYRKAADQDYTAGIYNLALCRFVHEEVRDYASAFELFSRAYDRSMKGCAYYLGLCYLHGYGTEPDPEKCLAMLREASDYTRTESSGEERYAAPLLLARIYDEGMLAERDGELAVKWYEIAAIRGSRVAEDRLRELGAERLFR